MTGWQGAERDQSADATEPPWTASTNPALTSLLDHLAQELAREYVRLMKLAADSEVPPTETEVH
jgi:hypothetical protein